MTSRALLILFVFASVPVLAQLPRNEVSLSAGWTEFADTGGLRSFGVSYSRYWNPVVSTELGAFIGRNKTTSADGERRFGDVHALVRIHAFRDRLVSPWLGAGAANVTYHAERSASQFGMIAAGGFDVRLWRGFAAGAQVHYAPFEVNPRDRFPLRLNPMTVTVAARWRS